MGYVAMCLVSAATASSFPVRHFIMAVYQPPNSVMYALLLPEVWVQMRISRSVSCFFF